MTAERFPGEELMTAFFGEVPPEPVPVRGVRLKVQPTGRLTLAHPGATGERIIVVQQVPATVSAADVLRRMERVAVLRRGSADYRGSRVVHFEEIREGAILR